MAKEDAAAARDARSFEEEDSLRLSPTDKSPPVCGAAWERLRLQLAAILRLAAQDLNLPPSAAATAGAAFHRGFPRFVSDHLALRRGSSQTALTEGSIKAQEIRRFIAASLFAAAKAADENITLRQVVAAVGFCWNACTVEGSLLAQKEAAGSEAAASGETNKSGGGFDAPPLQAGDGADASKRDPSGEDPSCPSNLGGYRIMTFRQYWRERQGCFVEEQRLMQALGFVLPGSEGGTLGGGRRGAALFETLSAAVVLARLSPAAASVALAVGADTAALELARGESPVVFAASVVVLAAKLARRFKEKTQQTAADQGATADGEAFLAADFPEEEDSEESDADDQAQVAESASRVGECTDSSGCARAPSCAVRRRRKSSLTTQLLQRLAPLLNGLKDAGVRGDNTTPPVCARVASCCKRILLAYALVLEDPPCSAFLELAAGESAKESKRDASPSLTKEEECLL